MKGYDESKVEALEEHLEDMGDLPTCCHGSEDAIARGILLSPQAHLDALVKAGVLEKTPKAERKWLTGEWQDIYRVVQPHPTIEDALRLIRDHPDGVDTDTAIGTLAGQVLELLERQR